MVFSATEMINEVLDYLVGTLWIAKEDLLKKRVSYYDQNSTRKGHPVLSLRQNRIIGNEKIPMLIGSSRKRGFDFRVTQVFGDEKETWFGSLGRFNAGDFTGGFKTQKLSQNRHKFRLNKFEMNLLNEWMTKRGLK